VAVVALDPAESVKVIVVTAPAFEEVNLITAAVPRVNPVVTAVPGAVIGVIKPVPVGQSQENAAVPPKVILGVDESPQTVAKAPRAASRAQARSSTRVDSLFVILPA
jgi:hypothetical protein